MAGNVRVAEIRISSNTIAAGKTGNSDEDVLLILLSVGEWSSAVSLNKVDVIIVIIKGT